MSFTTKNEAPTVAKAMAGWHERMKLYQRPFAFGRLGRLGRLPSTAFRAPRAVEGNGPYQ